MICESQQSPYMAGTLITAAEPSIADAKANEEYAAVQQILGSGHFAKAPLLSSFLTYVSQRALEDRMVRISEYEIGINVFQRSATFDPREDNIVRTYARHLRKRLQEYYETEGQSDKIRIDLPRGTYVPVFQTRDSHEETGDLKDEPASTELVSPTKSSPLRTAWTHPSIFGVAALLLATYSAALWWVARSTAHPLIAIEKQSTLHPLWRQLFRPDRDTFIIPGDIGFVIIQQANRRTFSLAEYLNWFSSQSPDAHMAMSYLRDQTYTSVLNMGIVSNLQRLPEAIANHFVIRAAKNVSLDDLRDGNAILIGSNYSNPWSELFSDKLNFHFVNHPNEDRFWIANEHPVEDEANTYEAKTTNTIHRTYAVVAFVENLDRSGHVLLLQGLDTAGTQAAADMLFNSDEIQNVIQKATGHSEAPKSFELLIEAESLDANSQAIDSRIIASRWHD